MSDNDIAITDMKDMATIDVAELEAYVEKELGILKFWKTLWTDWEFVFSFLSIVAYLLQWIYPVIGYTPGFWHNQILTAANGFVVSGICLHFVYNNYKDQYKHAVAMMNILRRRSLLNEEYNTIV